MKLSQMELANLVRDVAGCQVIVRNVLNLRDKDTESHPEVTHIAVRLYEAQEYAARLGSHLQSRQAIALAILMARMEWQNKTKT